MKCALFSFQMHHKIWCPARTASYIGNRVFDKNCHKSTVYIGLLDLIYLFDFNNGIGLMDEIHNHHVEQRNYMKGCKYSIEYRIRNMINSYVTYRWLINEVSENV